MRLLPENRRSPFALYCAKAAVRDRWRRGIMRTRLSICKRKQSYRSDEAARAAAQRADIALRPYRCDRCRLFHLTSRTKGKPVLRRGETPKRAF
jgi:hypothetical protein